MQFFLFSFATSILIFVTTWLEMATYTNESLQIISQKDMIPIALSLQNKLDQANNKVLEQIHKLNDNFSKLESEPSVTKQVDSLLSTRLINMERQCWANAQYSKRSRHNWYNIMSRHSRHSGWSWSSCSGGKRCEHIREVAIFLLTE